MPFLAQCQDHPDHASQRQSALREHLSYIESIMDKVAVAGPMSTESGEEYTASCFIYLTESRAEAEQLLRADPYYTSGLYAKVSLHYFRAAAGQWIGGATWQNNPRT